jgi:hypothetical protein
MAERVTVKFYDGTIAGPTLLMLTDDYQWVRTAGNDTTGITSGVIVMRDDTDAEEFEGVHADLPELLRHREKLLALDLPHVDVPEYGLRDVHPVAAALQVFEKLGQIEPVGAVSLSRTRTGG